MPPADATSVPAAPDPSTAPSVPSAPPAPASLPTFSPAPSAPIASPSAVSSEDIRDIRGPISIPYQWLWAAYVLGGVLVAFALYGLWRLLSRRAKAKAKLPFEIALDRLEEARALMTTDTVREYAFTASEIIRVYIEQQFGEKAAHGTTEEFLADLVQKANTPLAAHRSRLEDFLGHCDLSKFARWQFSENEMESMHASARDFILETRPQPEAAKASAKSPVMPAQPELAPVK